MPAPYAGAPATPRPTLRAGIAVVTQTFRGETSFVVRDPETRKYYRMREAEARVLRTFDGTRTAGEVAALLAAEGLRVTAATVEAFARSCTRMGLLERTLAERSVLQLERLRAERSRRRSLFRGELLRMRWSMGDPDALFDRTLPWVRWCFTRPFVVASLALFVAQLAVLAAEWTRFRAEAGALLDPGDLTPGRVLLLWAVFLVVVLIHELGHGYACKRFGGEVHEMGFMLMYFSPAFYCNVNDAWSFPALRHRLWVTAAGGWIELVVASLATLAWSVLRPGGLLAEVMLMATILGGGVALLSNANPLLPLDGYFALSDWLAIPNLRQRGMAHWGWWLRRHVLRLTVPEPPTADTRERRILLWYGGLASAYIAVTLAITATLVLRWGGRLVGPLGVLAGGALVTLSARAALRGWGRAVRDAVRLHGRSVRQALRRGRRPRVIAGALVAGLLLAAVVPWPLTTDGALRVASAGGLAEVVAAEGGVVAAVLVREGERVAAGAVLLQLRDAPVEQAREALGRSADSVAGLVTLAGARGDAAARGVMGAAARAAALRAASAGGRAALLTVRAPSAGVIATRHPERLLGRRLAAGAPALALVDADSVEARVALRGAGAALVRAGAPVRLVSHADVAHPVQASVWSVAPLGTEGGVEARVRLPRAGAWRPGVTGEASVRLGSSTVLGAAWWAMRARLRSDLLL
jgi:putative peptide zinc metalloprotease protein